MLVLVTGCAGFIGFHVAKTLLARGDTVVGVDNLSTYYDPALKEARLDQLRTHKTFQFVRCDVADRTAMDAIFAKHRFSVVCHLAAQAGVRYSLTDPFAYEHANNLGTLTLLEACRHHNVTRFVFASSSSVYGANTKLPFSESDKVDVPMSAYAATKRYNELLAYTYHSLYGLRCTGLRFFTAYGPWGRPDMALFKFTKAILAGEPIDVYGEGKQSRDFTFVDDIAAGVVAAIDTPFDYEIINLGRGKQVPLLAFIEAIEKELGRTATRNLLPMQQGDVRETSADITKARKLLTYDPKTDVHEGIHHFVTWYKQYYSEQS